MAISVSPLPDPGYRSLEILFTRNPATIHLTGELDLGSVQMVSDALLELEAEQTTPLIVDLTGVTFMDCSGLSLLVGAYNRARRDDRELVIANSRKSVRRMFSLTGCDYLVNGTDRETLQA